MYYLKSEDEELQCIALGHDLVEDTETTYTELRELGFTERVVKGIQALTKVPGETNEEYMARIKANPDAIRVKLQDLRHNSDIRRLKGGSREGHSKNGKIPQDVHGAEGASMSTFLRSSVPPGLKPASPNFVGNRLEREVFCKVVRNDKYLFRKVYYNSRGVQVAVVTSFSHEPEYGENPYFVEWHPFRVSIPLETSRRAIHFRSILKAERFVRRELTFLGRLLNSTLIVMTAGHTFARTGYLE
jgi:hypothetical protein